MRKNRRLIPALAMLYVLAFGANAQTVKDIDGNIYLTTQIGTQTWMSENLATTKLNDGTPIKFAPEENVWKELKIPGYCWLNSDIENKDLYGALYNWYAVNTKKLCPKGWHVPEDAEWTILVTYLGDPTVAGDKLKETGMKHWKNSLTYAPDDLGFTALPGGLRLFSGIYPDFVDSYAIWWTATPHKANPQMAWTRGLMDISSEVWKGPNVKGDGHSVRCLKD